MTKMLITYEGNLSTKSVHESGEVLYTDAPKDNMGRGEKFSPTDLLAISLGSCMLTMMGIFAKKYKVDIQGSFIRVEKEMSKDLPRRIVKIVVEFHSSAVFEENIAKALEKAAHDCPVHKSLHPDIEQLVTFNWGSDEVSKAG